MLGGNDIPVAQTDVTAIDLHRQKMGMVFQHFNLFPHKTVLQNITMAPVALKKKTPQEARQQADELERQYGDAVDRLRLYQQADHEQVRRELQALWQDCRERELQMRESVRESRSPAVAALSQAQLTYELEVQRILRDELPAYLHGENTCRDADRAEAASLYGEYAIDFAAQAVRHALLAALSAIDLQMSCDETNQSQSPIETEESV